MPMGPPSPLPKCLKGERIIHVQSILHRFWIGGIYLCSPPSALPRPHSWFWAFKLDLGGKEWIREVREMGRERNGEGKERVRGGKRKIKPLPSKNFALALLLRAISV